MPHGSDPLRRPDQQSPDSGAPVPPPWWNALGEERLPTETRRIRARTSWWARLQRVGVRLSAPLVALAVAGAIVAGGFGYRLVAGLVAAVLVVGLAVITLLQRRRSVGAGAGNRWR
ncbi:MAG TPA: hypothetical protein VNH20_06180 [Candidatus Dormibacteraeota bacterium]|nr:hypothetical protein [Candidatus Dormibacteraeota bacterium]